MSGDVDQIMLQASAALAQMDYPACEARCLEALALARDRADWAYYGRILMPLQEARRQRRLIAADGTVRLGTSDLAEPAGSWLSRLDPGCIVISRPFGVREARELHEAARRSHAHVEILLVDNEASADAWHLRSFAGPPAACRTAPPDEALVDRWLTAADAEAAPAATGWFLHATEALGDAALRQVGAEPGGPSRVEALESRLSVVTDHEILHQRLWDAAREAARI